MTAAARRGPTLAQGFCAALGVILVALGFLGLVLGGRHDLLRLATGALLLAGAPRAATARAACVIFATAYALVVVLGWLDGSEVLHTVLAALALIAAAAPTRRAGRPPARADREVLARCHAAYDASSPKQIFVGGRG